MVQDYDKVLNEIKVILLSGIIASSWHQLTSRLVRALQSPSPSEIAKGQKRNNAEGIHSLEAKYKVVKQEQGCEIVRKNS